MKSKEDKLNEKWETHKIIQEAIASAHMKPAPQTLEMLTETKAALKEIQTTLKDNYSKRELDEHHRDITERFTRQDTALESIKKQVEYTNGKVKTHQRILLVVGAVLATLLVTNSSELLGLFKLLI
jgi:DNA-binding transcriptional regulator GbsR (MarR family)